MSSSVNLNPFWQWNTESQNLTDWPISTQGPTYGVLPTLAALPHSMTFNFAMQNGSILNCSVNGANSLSYLYIATNSSNTTVSRRNGDVCAVITWQRHPVVEARGRIERQRTSEWLRLTTDRRRRTMTHNGIRYSWIPRNNAICLHGDDLNMPGELARITGAHTGVSLTLTITAFNSGFFEASVIAAVLFLSGRDID